MKNACLIVFFLCISIAANSQITKGNWLIGGSGGFDLTTYKSEAGQRNTGFRIDVTPNVGYFLADKFVTGISVGFRKAGTKATGTDIFSTNTFIGFGPFIRYYLLRDENPVNLIAEGSYQYGHIPARPHGTSKHAITFMTGPVFFFNTSTGLEFLVGYSTEKIVGFSGSNGTVLARIGIQFHLERDN